MIAHAPRRHPRHRPRSLRGRRVRRRDAHRAAADVCDEVDRLDRLVGNLLSMSRSRPACSNRSTRRSTCRVLLPPVAGAGPPAARDHRDDRHPGRMAFADGDFGQIEEVSHHLLGNAVRHVPDGSKVPSRAASCPLTSPLAKRHRVAVIDHGPGSLRTCADRLFEPFQKGRAAGRPAGACHLPRHHHGPRGIIRIDDTPGGGATIVFTIPARDSIETGESNGTGAREMTLVLVVDEEPSILARSAPASRPRLPRQDRIVLQGGDREDRGGTFDAVLLDLGLPDDDGVHVFGVCASGATCPSSWLTATPRARKVIALDEGATTTSSSRSRCRAARRVRVGSRHRAARTGLVDDAVLVVGDAHRHRHHTCLRRGSVRRPDAEGFGILRCLARCRQGRDASHVAARGVGVRSTSRRPVPAHLRHEHPQ